MSKKTQSQIMKERWADPEWRANICKSLSKAAKKAWKDPKRRELASKSMSLAGKRRMKNPAEKRRMKEMAQLYLGEKHSKRSSEMMIAYNKTNKARINRLYGYYINSFGRPKKQPVVEKSINHGVLRQ